MNSKELRNAFLEFFKNKGHTIKPSFSLIPDDPTLLFTVAGMVPFKNYFLRKVPITFTRAATCQKCIRTNDIENVGKTRRHLTFFEMLGNFSFGDYFKKEAIEWAWEFLTEVVKLPKNRLYISVYKEDEEAYEIWNKKIKIPTERIFKLGKDTNFWAMGAVGPCGYCSEIYFDLEGGKNVTQDDLEKNNDRFLEVWNLVFTQFNKKEDGSLEELEYKNIDTGMGLERLATVSQGVYSNFETDLFMPIIQKIAKRAGIQYKENEKTDISLRVIADHLRAMTFLICDGVLPSNEGRGYVLRRIIRRSVRHGKNLGLSDLFLYELVPAVINIMKDFYFELDERKDYIMQIVKIEEEKFKETLEKGMEILENEIQQIKNKGEKVISGDIVFKLYDTYGFPIEITQEILQENNLIFEKERFDKLMENQKEIARKSWKNITSSLIDEVSLEIIKEIDTTQFLGYDKLKEENCKVIAIIKNKNKIGQAKQGEEIFLILDKTPFYAESGGQIGDTGLLLGQEIEILVNDTQKIDERYIHKAKVIKGEVKEGILLNAIVDEEKRKDIMRNHSATHLLQAALRKILGIHVEQAGSFVGYDKLRFDFTHFSQITKDEIIKIEDLVNIWIKEAIPVEIKYMNFDEAKNRGAIALFEEKYKDEVRTIKMGDISFELCGGTHVKNTGEIGIFKIIYEGSISAGIRRIEAITGNKVLKILQEYDKFITDMKNIFQFNNFAELFEKIHKLNEENKILKKQIEDIKKEKVLEKVDDYLKSVQNINGINTIIIKLNNIDKETIRELGDKIKTKVKRAFILIINILDNKVNLLSMVTDDLTDKLDASFIVKEVAKVCGGGGGGKKNMAEAGGRDISKIDEAIEKAIEIIKKA